MRMRRAQAQPAVEATPRWLVLAQHEIGVRVNVDESEQAASLERELQMQVRLRTNYPDVPVELAIEFSRQLEAGYFTWEAWDNAAAWLEATKWFKQSSSTT